MPSAPFVAEIMIFGCNFAPQGFAFCEGQLMPISQNTALFSLLGTYYGGDGKSNFGLPNLQGRVPIGVGQGQGLTQRDLGEQGGVETVTLTLAELPSHTHLVTQTPLAIPVGDVNNTYNPVGNYLGTTAGTQLYGSIPDTGNIPLKSTIQAANGGYPNLPLNNMQPYLALNFVIALQGVFPPRT
ncbi:microcystin-dependent protein [Chitinophaga polysaccharea]|uniref:Microcystin-dependent protein n=1 Tax=Chitinophaga polysaccharea TaxID=1293035 RepID=A0A561PP27_9BACT|nr:tail fiber protein [Chitinophaga polysaccharea]TWF39862.1 microcystin-dependent protein [Chitinophaga polysaccharea]